MAPTLPRASAAIFGAATWALISVACAHRDPIPTGPPPPPLPAADTPHLGTMEAECDGLVVALTSYRECPNLEDEEDAELDAWIERANRDFAASRKANPEPNAQSAIAEACHKATDSVNAAHERCNAGPRPKVD